MEIKNINYLMEKQAKNPFIEGQKGEYTDFAIFLKDAVDNVNRYQLESQELDKLFVSGQMDNIDELMIAAEKADIALNLMIEIKNKIMDAYREIMRLQL